MAVAYITKTCLCNIIKLGFTGVYIIFLISAQKHRLWVLVRTASEKISEFLFENFHFLVAKFSIYLNRRVFVMHGFIAGISHAADRLF